LATDEITWSEELYRIFEFDPGVPVTLELIGTRVHAEDIPLVDDMIDRARGAGSDFEFEHQLQMLDHSVKYLHMVAHGTRDQDGQLEYTGAVQDVTQRRSSEEALGKARSELAHVARVTSLGVLTASIAHEVNQPLSGIITNASTCLRMLAADPPNVDCCNIPWVLKNSFKGISPTKSRSQAIECSFAVDAEMHGSYCFGSFFNSHSPLH
jgi:signal transduction histidine kinase